MTALLDTDILSEIFRGKNATVMARATAYVQVQGRYRISSITEVEIARGGTKALSLKWSSDPICPKSTRILSNRHHLPQHNLTRNRSAQTEPPRHSTEHPRKPRPTRYRLMHQGDNRQMLSSLEGLNAYAEPGEALGARRLRCAARVWRGAAQSLMRAVLVVPVNVDLDLALGREDAPGPGLQPEPVLVLEGSPQSLSEGDARVFADGAKAGLDVVGLAPVAVAAVELVTAIAKIIRWALSA